MTVPAPSDLDPTQTMVGSSNGVGLWIAPEGTPAPATVDDPFATPWAPLGYASDDGVTIGGDTSSESFTPWQSTTPIKTIITERTRTVGFTLWQLNQTTLGLYFDQDLSAESGDAFDFDVRSDAPHQVHAIAVDTMDGDRKLRFVYPRATLESTGDIALQKGAMVPLECTLSALDDAGTMVHVYLGAATGAVQASNAQAPQQGETAQPATAEQPVTVGGGGGGGGGSTPATGK